MNTAPFLSRMPQASRRRETKPTSRRSRSSEVISFRLKNDEIDKLQKALPAIVPEDSRHLLGKKVLRDFIDGHLVYLSRQDRVNSRIAG